MLLLELLCLGIILSLKIVPICRLMLLLLKLVLGARGTQQMWYVFLLLLLLWVWNRSGMHLFIELPRFIFSKYPFYQLESILPPSG